MPQQRKLAIVMGDKTKFETNLVTLSDAAEKELKKAFDQAKAHGGPITSIELKKV